MSDGTARLTFNANHNLIRYDWQTSYLGPEIRLDSELFDLRNRWK